MHHQRTPYPHHLSGSQQGQHYCLKCVLLIYGSDLGLSKRQQMLLISSGQGPRALHGTTGPHSKSLSITESHSKINFNIISLDSNSILHINTIYVQHHFTITFSKNAIPKRMQKRLDLNSVLLGTLPKVPFVSESHIKINIIYYI